jgi:hypothetical protein
MTRLELNPFAGDAEFIISNEGDGYVRIQIKQGEQQVTLEIKSDIAEKIGYDIIVNARESRGEKPRTAH